VTESEKATAGKWLAVLLGAFGLILTTAQAVDDLARPIRVSPDHHFLSQSDGRPFFWLGDTAIDLFVNLTREEVETYLQDRASKGFTMIWVVAMGSGFGGDINPPNRYGQHPFLNSDPTRPNAPYWDHVDWCIARAGHYGLRVALSPTSASVTISGRSEDRLFDAAKANTYGRWLASRFRGRGISWVLGGDANPLWSTGSESKQAAVHLTLADFSPIYDAMAKGIAQGEGGDPFITYHPSCCSFRGTAEPRTSLYLGDRDWLTMNMIQSGQIDVDVTAVLRGTGLGFAWRGAYNYQPIFAEYESSPARPVIDGEPAAEDLLFEGEQPRRFSAYESRNRAYHSIFAGAAGHTFFNINMEHLYDPDRGTPVCCGMRMAWKVALNSDGAHQMQYVKALMLSRPYYSRLPDQSVLVGAAGEGAVHISATRDKNGSYAMLYAPQGEPITVALSKLLSGPTAVAWWYDPRTGVASQVVGRFPTTETQVFTPPTSGSDSDWVLVVDDANMHFPPPGTVQAK
jgi:hypothetical protein